MNNQKLISAYKIARTLAETMEESIRHVSIIMSPQGNFLASGINSRIKTHPLNNVFNYPYEALHSEMAAFLAIRWNSDKRLILINFRFNNHLQLRFSKPCKYCQKFIPQVFEKTWYSLETDSDIIIENNFRRFYYV